MTNSDPSKNLPAADRWGGFQSPLEGRYASRQMQALWSARRRFESWRKLWLALAQAQHELGLPVTAEQVEAIRKNLVLKEEDFARAAEHERRLRHDVMAHVHALGEAAPVARPILHLGMTSQDINCNTELPILRDSLDLIAAKLARVIDDLARFAEKHRGLPCLGFTHFQPAQPTTVGKRAAMWASDLALCLERLEFTRNSLRLRGIKGATGTQASFLDLFGGDEHKVLELERRVARALGWPEDSVLVATGQTYPRVVDAFIVQDLAASAAGLHKLAGDIRLLANKRELDEPFEAEQVGSSAMPYKRNPMRSERIAGLCRVVMSFASAALDTAADQWLERTLDDSAARRLFLPEAFLALDGALDLAHNVASGLIVNEGAIRRNLEAEMPFLATEALMMASVKLGRDRQAVHEAIRAHAMEAAALVKRDGKPSDLFERLSREPLLAGVDLARGLDPAGFVGRAPAQVDEFVRSAAAPIRRKYEAAWGALEAPSLRV